MYFGGVCMVIREYEGRTERDAIKKASEDLGVQSDQLKIEVITEKAKFFSFGNPVKIRVYLDDLEQVDSKKVEDFLVGLFKTIGVDVTIETYEEVNKLYVEIISESAGLIIGKRGKTLESLQLLTNIILNKNREEWKKVVLDIENYRDKRESTLKELALKVAEKVKKSGKSQLLEPMNPFERRIIHMTLQNDPDVNTKSEGNGSTKKVRVYLKRRKK
jgi:spoIIIJ-associated protein